MAGFLGASQMSPLWVRGVEHVGQMVMRETGTAEGHTTGASPHGQARSPSRTRPRPSDDVHLPNGTASPPEVVLAGHQPPLRRILLGADLVAIAAGWTVALAVAFSTGQVVFGPVTAAAQSVLIIGAGVLLMSAAGLYRRRVCAIRSIEVARIGRVSLALAVTTVVVLASVGRDPALYAGVLGGLAWFMLLAIERGVLREWISGRRATGDFGAPVLVVGGASVSTLETAGFLADNPVLGFRVRGVSCPPTPQVKTSSFAWYGNGDLVEQVRRSRASGVVVDSSSLTGSELNTVVQQLEATGIHVHISSGLRGIDVRRITVSPLADEAFLHLAPMGLTRRQVWTKRAVDVVGAVTALMILAPILLVSGLLIWAGDRGPILFRQERIGKDREPFKLFKLRTMVVDAEQLKPGLAGGNERSGPLFKLGRDPRVTTVGHFLRASSVDEIPQLFNVLEGTMSLVGPRPALPDEVAQFDDQLNTRLTVKPGVTGLWQVEARDLPSFDLYRRYDLLYVQNWSLGVDLAIILRTIVVVALRAFRAVLPARFRAAEVVG